jgi:hypothetical protein
MNIELHQHESSKQYHHQTHNHRSNISTPPTQSEYIELSNGHYNNYANRSSRKIAVFSNSAALQCYRLIAPAEPVF